MKGLSAARSRSAPITSGLTVCCLLATMPVRAAVIPQKDDRDAPHRDETVAMAQRLVHHFDFDERGKGNLEDVPKYWEPLRLPGFPHYTEGRFDFGVGEPQPPSFYLASEGRNVAYRYAGPEAHVHPGTAYRIVAFIRAHNLERARACLGVHYSDGLGQAIPRTTTRSRYVGTAADVGRWARVELYLPPAPPEADRIGLIVDVLQQRLWADDETVSWHVPRTDVRGGAWFDSISIYALPQIQITTGAPGNVVMAHDPQVLRIVVADQEASSIRGLVTIVAADGRPVETHQLAVTPTSAQSLSLPIGHLPPGLYRANLEVRAGTNVLAGEDLTFARLAPFEEGTSARSDAFGIVLDPNERSEPEIERRLLGREMIGSVKLPVGDDRVQRGMPSAVSRGGDLPSQLAEDGFTLTGVFYSLPEAAIPLDEERSPPLSLPSRADEGLRPDPDERDDGESILEAAASERKDAQFPQKSVMTDRLRRVASYASLFRWWQVGGDVACGPDYATSRATLPRGGALRKMDEAMRPLLREPRLAAPLCDQYVDSAELLVAQQVSLGLPPGLDAGRIRERVARLKKQGFERVSVYVPPLSSERFERMPRLAEWAQRLIAARHAGADNVFVPQTWAVRETSGAFVTEPLETYVVWRTIAALLGDAEPGPVVHIGDGVTALAFYQGDTAVLALWENSAPPCGRVQAVQLGRSESQYDVWGQRRALRRDSRGRQQVHLSPMPVLIPDVERWLIDLRTSIEIVPSHTESGTELTRHRLRIAYSAARPLSARIRFEAPSAWRIEPRVLDVVLGTGEAISRNVEIHYPHNEPAGKKTLVASMKVAGVGYELDVPLPVDVGLADLGVSGFAAVEGTDVVLRQFVTNETSEALSFRGYAVVPGRERRHRPIPLLQPGETQIVEYRFGDAEELIGRRVHLVLREANDGRRIHTLELNVP